jgi:hypothetical protein
VDKKSGKKLNPLLIFTTERRGEGEKGREL